MEYTEFVNKTSSLFATGSIIAALQRGEEIDDRYIHSVMNKTYELANGRRGDILCLSIELQRYLAAVQLMEYNTISSDEEVIESLNVSLENFNGEDDLKNLIDNPKSGMQYEKMIVEKTANLQALNLLKDKYLSTQRVI